MDLSAQLQVLYEIEGLINLQLSFDTNTKKWNEIDELINDKIIDLMHMRGKSIVSDDSGMDSEAIAEAATFEEQEDSDEERDTNAPRLCCEDVVDADKVATLEDDAIDISLPESVDKEMLRRHLPLTLNDQFRFKRELFGNSDVDYKTTIHELEQMPNFDCACNYLHDNFDWDFENDDVKDFVAIIKNAF